MYDKNTNWFILLYLKHDQSVLQKKDVQCLACKRVCVCFINCSGATKRIKLIKYQFNEKSIKSRFITGKWQNDLVPKIMCRYKILWLHLIRYCYMWYSQCINTMYMPVCTHTRSMSTFEILWPINRTWSDQERLTKTWSPRQQRSAPSTERSSNVSYLRYVYMS